jgi:DNA repair protein RadC
MIRIIPAARIGLRGGKTPLMQIQTASDAAALFAPYFAGAVGERVAAIHLDKLHAMIALTLEEPGGAHETDLPIGPLLARALRVGADAIIVAHNHPSGDPTPSEADIAATRRLADAASAVSVRLFDHLIFAGGECRSFRALGLL